MLKSNHDIAPQMEYKMTWNIMRYDVQLKLQHYPWAKNELQMKRERSDNGMSEKIVSNYADMCEYVYIIK